MSDILKVILSILNGFVLVIVFLMIWNSSNYILAKSQWECTATDIRPNHGECVEYGLVEQKN